MTDNRILIVDDEEDLCEILQFNLEMEGFRADTANSAEEALKKDLTAYSLILLDVMMGEISGFRMARILKENPATAAIPVIFLTARDNENDLITGFNLGADDYITKPFSIREVMLRVKAVTRRISAHAKDIPHAPAETVVTYENLSLHPRSKKVTLGGKEISLTKKEFEILSLLLRNRNRVYSREEILSQVWTDEVCVLDRTVDVNITRLRRKIGPYGKNIVTRLGYGYTFEEQ